MGDYKGKNKVTALDQKVEEFVLDLLDKEIEEVHKALSWESTPFRLEDIDKLVESRQYLTESGELDGRANQVCFNWLEGTVNGYHPNDVEDCTEHMEMATLRVVGGVFMLCAHYEHIKSWAQDQLCDAWDRMPKEDMGLVYRKYIDWITVDPWHKVDLKDIRSYIGRLWEIQSGEILGDFVMVESLMTILGELMEAIPYGSIK